MPETPKQTAYAKRKALGICQRCPAPARPGKVTCAKCSAKDVERATAYRATHLDEVNAYRRDWAIANRERTRDKRNADAKRCYQRNRERVLARQKGWRQDPANRAKKKSRELKSKYGITLAQWTGMFKAQGERCAICRRTEPDGRGWATDHDHDTGEVRGVLCVNCNAAIGMFFENSENMRRAIKYLKRTGRDTAAEVPPLLSLIRGGGDA